jgi:hypothetical protein
LKHQNNLTIKFGTVAAHLPVSNLRFRLKLKVTLFTDDGRKMSLTLK